MEENRKPEQELGQEQEQYKVWFDSGEKNVMFLSIPLKQIAGASVPLDAQVYLRGFFEEVKEQALLQLAFHRRNMAGSKILTPGSVKLGVH